jgi:hypothetical protein
MELFTACMRKLKSVGFTKVISSPPPPKKKKENLCQSGWDGAAGMVGKKGGMGDYF